MAFAAATRRNEHVFGSLLATRHSVAPPVVMADGAPLIGCMLTDIGYSKSLIATCYAKVLGKVGVGLIVIFLPPSALRFTSGRNAESRRGSVARVVTMRPAAHPLTHLAQPIAEHPT